MSVLELGSGPGFSTEKLLTLLPTSQITAIEVDPVMVQQTRQSIQAQPTERFIVVEASAVNTGLPNNCMDFAIARLLFQHLPDPVEVAKETFRVLKPGGVLVITDVDGDLYWLLDPPLPEADLISEKLSQGQAAQSGNRLIGRKLWRILKLAGFQDLNLELIPAHSDDLGMQAFLPQLDPDLLLQLVKVGLLSDAELLRIQRSRKAFMNASDPFVLLQWFMVSGVKR